MRIGEISFCDKIGYNIRSDETKKYILEKLEKKYGIRIIARHYEKYDQNKLMILNNNPHMICVRSNGNPYMLYLTRYNNIDICIFIDKKVQQGYFLPRMIICHLMMGKDVKTHDDTIFDGEMVKMTNGKWVYLINDMLVHKGQKLNDINLVKRLNMTYTFLDEEYIEDDMSFFQIAVKKYFTYDMIDTLTDHVSILPYTCRGLYFKPLFLKFNDILINFDDNLIKKVQRQKIGGTFLLTNDVKKETVIQPVMKEASKSHLEKRFHTRRTASPDVFEIFEGVQMIGTACIPTLTLSKKMRELFEYKNLVDKIEVSYIFNEKFKKWVPSF